MLESLLLTTKVAPLVPIDIPSASNGYVFYTDFRLNNDESTDIVNLINDQVFTSNIGRSAEITPVPEKNVGVFAGSNGILVSLIDAIGTEDFCLELVVYLDKSLGTTKPTMVFFSNYTSNTKSGSSTAISLGYSDTSGTKGLYGATSYGSNHASGVMPVLGEWFHYCGQRKNGVYRSYYNGRKIIEYAHKGNLTVNNFGLGRYGGGTGDQRYATCLMSEILVAKKCRYNFDGFTPDITDIAKDAR